MQLYIFRPVGSGAAVRAFCDEARAIPGVVVANGAVTVTADLALPLARFADEHGIGIGTPTIRGERQRAARSVESVRGFDRLWAFQQQLARIAAGQAEESPRYVPLANWHDGIRRDVRTLWAPCGCGKTGIGLVTASSATTPRAPALVVTKAAGRESYLRDAKWAGDFRKVGLLLGRYPASDDVRVAVRRLDKRFLGRFRDEGLDCAAYCDAGEATTAGCDLLIASWETLAVGESIKTVDDTGIERRKKTTKLRDDLRRAWSAIVFDEMHYAANRQSMRSDVAAQLATMTRFCFGMTASGVRAGLQDLWSQFNIVAPQAWGNSRWKYQLRYLHATDGAFGGLEIGDPKDHFPRRGSSSWPCAICERTSAELSERVAHYVEVRDLSEIRSQLPPKTRVFDRFPWPEKFKKAQNGAASASTFERALELAAELATPRAIERAVELIASGAKVVILGQRLQWVGQTVAALKAELPRAILDRLWLRASYEDGSTLNPMARAAMAAEYMRQEGPAVIVGTIGALSEAIDLQDTDAALFCVLPFTTAQVTQAEGRFQRIGQRRPTQMVYLIPEGTIAERIYSTLLSQMVAVGTVGAATDDQAWQAGVAKTDDEIVADLKSWLAANASDSGGVDDD